MSTYYAIRKPYGLSAINQHGRRPNELHRFRSAAERDVWVGENTSEREAVKASDSLVRRVLASEDAEHAEEFEPLPYTDRI